jgi:anti-sigma B factor antagonist
VFNCAWRSGYGARWATLAGELDAYTAPLLDEELRDAEADAELIVLDLRGLDFMDCRGMRVMLQSSERLRRAGRRMVLVRGSRNVDLVFTRTGHTEAVEIFDLAPAEPAVQVLLQLAGDCA